MVQSRIKISDIYEQNTNFLIGSGASFGLLPTLQLALKDNLSYENYTIESLSVKLEKLGREDLNSLLLMYYYKNCIEPAITIDLDLISESSEIEVIGNYRDFLKTILEVIKRQKPSDRKCNIYTTNYDGCFEHVAETALGDGDHRFILCDGTSGFKKRYFHTKNYNNRTFQRGIFDKHSAPVPQINLMHLHGSVYWKRDDFKILADYNGPVRGIELTEEQSTLLDKFSGIIGDDSKTEEDLLQLGENLNVDADNFWKEYQKIPIVSPTKWKFYETVFEENYYQLLRHLSFELERPNTTFITFGFSFADEHILHLVQRSLSNPSLTLYVCCFNQVELQSMEDKFKGYSNVKLVTTEEDLTFTVFNKEVFSTTELAENGDE